MKYMELLGHKVKDQVTGFVGVVASVSYDLYGCVGALIKPAASKDNKDEDAHWFDAKRLLVLSKAPVFPPPTFSDLVQELGPEAKPAPRSQPRP